MQAPQDACVLLAHQHLGIAYLECSFCDWPHTFQHCTGKAHLTKVWERWERLKASGVTYGVGRQEFWQYWCEQLAYNHLDGEIRLIPLASAKQSLSINLVALPQSSPSEALLPSGRTSISAAGAQERPCEIFCQKQTHILRSRDSRDHCLRTLERLVEVLHKSPDFTPMEMEITLRPAKQHKKVLWTETF